MNTIGTGGSAHASSLVLPVVAGVKVVGGLPPCRRCAGSRVVRLQGSVAMTTTTEEAPPIEQESPVAR
jgi:hypothetical protein